MADFFLGDLTLVPWPLVPSGTGQEGMASTSWKTLDGKLGNLRPVGMMAIMSLASRYRLAERKAGAGRGSRQRACEKIKPIAERSKSRLYCEKDQKKQDLGGVNSPNTPSFLFKIFFKKII